MVAYARNYAETPAWVEVEPGVQRRLDRCTVNHLAAARRVVARKAHLRAEAEHLLAVAASYNIDVDEDLRDRLSLWACDLPAIQSLVSELQNAVLQPA